MPNAKEVLDGRIEYYLESAGDGLEDVQGFALELLATTMLDLQVVQHMVDEYIGTEDEESSIAEVVTTLVNNKAREVQAMLGIEDESK
jgi:hypothetical protein